MSADHGQIDWPVAVKPLIKKYKGKKHPLDYGNVYQLLVMVVLSAQDSDANINRIAPGLFEQFPTMAALSKASTDELLSHVSKVRGHRKKIGWLQDIASEVRDDINIPLNMDGLVKLKGIGRKSANVILREAGAKPGGIMVDLHVMRVVPRLGMSQAATGDKMEKDLMEIFPKNQWKDLGMALSYLGRETCRPTNPKHSECVMNPVCAYCREKGICPI